MCVTRQDGIGPLEFGIIYRVGQKTGLVGALITQRWLVVESRVIRQKFQNAVKN